MTVSIPRDTFGKTTSITRSGNGKSATRRYVYDLNERLCKTIEPETGSTVQAYDLANNVTWRASGMSLSSSASCDDAPAAKKVSYQYDALNRLKTTSYGDGSPSIERTYTRDGLPETIKSNGALWTTTYNRHRLNEGERLDYGGLVFNIIRRYDANGSLKSIAYPPDNQAIEYTPNALGEPSQVGSYATQITYHPNGAIHTFRYGNGITHTMEQYERGLPKQSTDAGVFNDHFSYDANANVVAIEDQQTGRNSRAMGYDGLDRLTSVGAPGLWGNAVYGYDALDNLVSTNIAGNTARNTIHTINPTTNRLDNISNGPPAYTFNYAYDDQGNIIKRGSQTYAFDQANRMKRADGKATYAYDGLGHRISVVGTDGVNRLQLYSPSGQLLYAGPTNGSGTKYIYLHQHQIAEVQK